MGKLSVLGRSSQLSSSSFPSHHASKTHTQFFNLHASSPIPPNLSQVWRAKDKYSKEIVALKRVRMDNEREGVRYLHAFSHPSTLELLAHKIHLLPFLSPPHLSATSPPSCVVACTTLYHPHLLNLLVT